MSTLPALPVLEPSWQDWLAGSVVGGKSDEEMLATMLASNFDEHYARVAINVVRSMTERVQAQNPAMLGHYLPDPHRLPKTPIVRAADKDVVINFTLDNPNIAVISGILSPDECKKIIQLSGGKLQRSFVVEKDTGKLEVSDVRRSDGCHFERGENAIVQRLEQRIAALTGIPVEQGEPLQILHYHETGEYLPHHDYFAETETGSAQHIVRGGQRIATMVIYLSQVAQGGDTHFPEIELTVKPQVGSAVYFEYHNSQGQLDSRCLHAGMPVTKGDKWIATKWFRASAY
jgi:prolyl 4-hydroxylase